jgi:nucleoid-associated protein YgaU
MPDYKPAVVLKAADPKVIAGFLDAWRGSKAPRKALLALVAAGIVEANLKNPTYGDRDSVGSLQQRRGWGSTAARMDPERAATAFLNDLMSRVWPKHNRETAGQLAQRVQRSAYPDRYDEALPAAEHVIARFLGHDDDPDELPPPAVYVVRSGDTLTAIAKRHDTTVAALVKLNTIRDPDVIRVGQRVRIR